MARYQFSDSDRSKGGRNQPREAKIRGGQNGFQKTCETHPYFARKHLKNIIRGTYHKEDFERGKP